MVQPSMTPIRDKYNREAEEDARRHKANQMAVYDWLYHPEDGRLLNMLNSPKIGKTARDAHTGRMHDIYEAKGFKRLYGDELLAKIREQQAAEDASDAAQAAADQEPQPEQQGRRGVRRG